MNYAPIIRIILRYLVGAVFMGSSEVGAQLAADPDLVAMGAIGLGLAVEAAYALAKRGGGST